MMCLDYQNLQRLVYAINRYYVNLDIWVNIHEQERMRQKQVEILKIEEGVTSGH